MKEIQLVTAKLSAERRGAGVAGITTATIVAALVLSACQAKPVATSTPATTLSDTRSAYELFLSALTATAESRQANDSSATPTPQPPRYPFRVVYRDFSELSAADDSMFTKLLSLAPDTGETRQQLWLNDLTAFWGMWEQVGVERPTAEDGAEAYRAGLRDVISKLRDAGLSTLDLPVPDSPPWISGLGDRAFTGTVDFFPYTGADARNTDATLRSGQGWSIGFSRARGTSQGNAPDDVLEIAVGSYDADAIAQTMERCGDCVPFEPRDHNGTSFMAWGKDFQQSLEDRLAGPFHDQLGRGGRVAVFDGALYRALTTDGIEQLIDARIGSLSNLGQNEDYRLAAAGLANLDVHSALLSATDFSFRALEYNLSTICIAAESRAYSGASRPITGEQGMSSDGIDPSRCMTSGHPGSIGTAVAGTSPLMRPFTVAAFGNAWDRERAATDNVIVLIHADESSARENVGLLLRRLAETRVPNGISLYAQDIDRVEIGAVGRVLLAKVVRKADALPVEFLQLNIVPHIPLAIHE